MLTDPSRWESLKTGSLCPLFIAITQQLITVFSAFVEFEQETCLYGYPDRKFLPRGPLPMGGIRSSQSISCRSQVNLKKPESKKDGTPFTPFHGRKSHTRGMCILVYRGTRVIRNLVEICSGNNKLKMIKPEACLSQRFRRMVAVPLS